MDVSEIVDQKSFEAWLAEQSEDRRYEVAVALATRCALRVFPIWAAAMHEGWAREVDLTVLPVVRSLTISWVAVRKPTSKVKRAAAVARSLTSSTASVASRGDDYAAKAGAAAYAAATATAAATYAAARADEAAEMWGVLHQDIRALDHGEDLLSLPLWSEELPSKITREWSIGRRWMQTNAGYSFWIRWYEAVLAGRPLTGDWDNHWQLMHDIALIDPEDWGDGKEPDAIRVAGIIDLIIQKHALRQEVARAKQALENETFNAMSLGRHRDNMPDDMPSSQIVEYRARLQELEAALDEVDAALEPPIPDVEVLEEATGRLWAIWEKIKKYPVALAFVTLIGAAATGAAGQAGVRGMDWVWDNGMPQLIRGLKDIAPKPSAPQKAPKGWEKPSVDL